VAGGASRLAGLGGHGRDEKSRRRELERRRRTAEEVREILDAMKSLAYMETRKLARFLEAQRRVVRHVERNAEDLLAYYPDCLPSPEAGPRGYLLVGSERGFCGDFNGALLRRLEQLSAEASDSEPRTIAVRHKLCVRLEGDPRVAALLDGATVVEEVEEAALVHWTNVPGSPAQPGAAAA
jgi:F-type H+-transporting ATPase subunit gamma